MGALSLGDSGGADVGEQEQQEEGEGGSGVRNRCENSAQVRLPMSIHELSDDHNIM